MIQIADSKTSPCVRQMWEACFNDTPAFVDFYFTEKYKADNTLIYFEDGRPAASLQMVPYRFTFCGVEVDVSYISGACTYPHYRSRGYMGRLLGAAFKVMQQRDIPLSILIPAEERLYSYYARCGYQMVFESGGGEIPLKQIIENSGGDMDQAYLIFDRLFRNKDFTVQKTKSDFRAVVKDAELDNYPPKTNLSGMARIIDAQKLLSLFAEKYPHKNVGFAVQDDLISANTGFYEINAGCCRKMKSNIEPACIITPPVLCRLLFGFHLEDCDNDAARHFVPHQPVMNLMLE